MLKKAMKKRALQIQIVERPNVEPPRYLQDKPEELDVEEIMTNIVAGGILLISAYMFCDVVRQSAVHIVKVKVK